MLKKIDFFYIFILITCFWVIVYLKSPHVFSWKFDPNLINLYKRSQDITHEVKGRVHLSDSDIYIATGYLYATGKDPTDYNFWHPPLIKYLYGASVVFFNNPLWVQIVFSSVYISLTYFLGIILFKSRKVALFSALLLAIDPLLLSLTSEALLDLGQAVFSLAYLISVIIFPASYILQGILLGLFAGSKFWSTAVFFVFFIYIYKKVVLKEKINFTKFIYSIAVATVIFSLFYIKTYINTQGEFDIFIFQLKSLKLIIQHNLSPLAGGTMMLFLTGRYFTWWEGGGVVKSDTWTILWPISFLASLFNLRKIAKQGLKGIVFSLPLVYLIFTFKQLPFTRYFILILPYLYISLAYLTWKLFDKKR